MTVERAEHGESAKARELPRGATHNASVMGGARRIGEQETFMMDDSSYASIASQTLASLRAIEARLIERDELSQLGHRIVYDTKTGWSTNVSGCHCDPSKLDEHGYQVRL